MKTARAILKKHLHEAAEEYWRVVTGSGWSQSHVEDITRRLCHAALRLHIFEQGFRAGKRDRES